MSIDTIPDKLLNPEVIGPLVVTPAFFFSVIATVAIILWFGARRERERHALAQSFLEKGHAVPPELLAKPARVASDLRRGVILLAGGVGLGAALLLSGERQGAGFSLIPTLMGFGYLVVWWIENKRRDT